MDAATRQNNFGLPWLLLCLALVVHCIDEAFTDFLGYFNATVLTLYGHFSRFPRIDMNFRQLVTLFVLINGGLLALTPFAYRNARFLRPVAYAFACLTLLNGMAHTVFTILGHTVPSVQFEKTAPGFFSAPLLIAGAIHLLLRLRSTSRSAATN
jgi:hypothetical protein